MVAKLWINRSFHVQTEENDLKSQGEGCRGRGERGSVSGGMVEWLKTAKLEVDADLPSAGSDSGRS